MSPNTYLAIYFFTGLVAARLTVKNQHKFGGARQSEDLGETGANNLTWYLMMITGWPLLFLFMACNLIDRWNHHQYKKKRNR